MALEVTTCFENIRKRTTLFQRNARDLRERLSDFRQFMQEYRFPVIVVSESRVGNESVFPAMNTFILTMHGAGINRVLVGVRKYLKYISHTIPSHPDIEYLALAVTLSGQALTVVGAYVPPSAILSEQRLEHIIGSTPTPHIVTGDFNVHNTA